MNSRLFREDCEVRDSDIHFSHVGPGHERAYFNLIPLAGYAALNAPTWNYAKPPPPFQIYSMSGAKPTQQYRSLGAAKSAVRRWIVKWLGTVSKQLQWMKLDTGVHFKATANGIEVGSYYYNPTPKRDWHQGFRVYFGGTYYVTDFQSTPEAREAVQETFSRWLDHAKASLLQ